MSILTFYKGKIGDDGENGENGTGVSDIRESLIDNPNFSALYNNRESRTGDLTVSRAGEALLEDRYGGFEFISGDDITNYIQQSNTFSLWGDINNFWTLSATGQPDPLGGNDASNITLDSNIVSGDDVMESIATGMTAGPFHTMSFYFKVISGTITGLELKVGPNVFPIKATLGSTFERVNVSIGLNVGSGIIGITPIGLSGAVFGLFAVQFENGSNVHDYIPTTVSKMN